MRIINFITISIIHTFLLSCNYQINHTHNYSDTLYIIHAGSLSKTMKELIDSFKHISPNTFIYTEACGSKQCVQNIMHLHRRYHIFFSSDKELIDNFLVPSYCKQSYPFVSNAMVVAYTNRSKYNNEINNNNWYQILTRPDVIVGYSNPETDPCGERFLGVLTLAEQYYHQTLINKIIHNDKKFLIRPKEIDLIALLELNQIDYTLIYKSLAIQHHLKFIELPDSLNLSASYLENWYNKFYIHYKNTTQPIKVIYYGYGILKETTSTKQFINFLNTPIAKKILVKHGHKIIY